MRKVVSSLLLLSISVSLSGCGLFETLEGQEEKRENEFSNVYELKSEAAYVWKNNGRGDIKKDLSEKRSGKPVFFSCPKGDINFAGNEMADIDEYPRSIWIASDKDDEIPTVTSDDALIYISDTKVPEEIVFERFADYGYSIGVSNMEADGGGHYYFTYAETDEDDYKYYVDLNSRAKDICSFDTISRLYLDKVGEDLVTEENVSDGGTVVGLQKDKEYVCEFYTGTFYQDFKLPASIHSFGKLERFISYDYEFLHANCIKIKIPEYFKSGYYYIQGAGLFRYVTDIDAEIYDGKAYDPDIDWNEPIIKYDEYGVIIYDPSQKIDRRDVEETSDPGISDEEIVIGETKEKGSETDE